MGGRQGRIYHGGPQVVELGEQFRLAFSVNANGQNLKLPNLSDFDVLMGPSTSQSTSFQIINGVSSQSVSYSYLYVLRAKKEGHFTINPGSITVGGTEYTSNSQTVEVVKGSQTFNWRCRRTHLHSGYGSQKDLFVRMNLDKRSLYKGEHLTATIKIYSKVNLNGLRTSPYQISRDSGRRTSSFHNKYPCRGRLTLAKFTT